jgi:5-methyltetrahydrofolate--homocysteine methyltransferase
MSLDNVYTAVLNGNAPKAVEATNAALADGTPADNILHEACIPAMTEVGRLFESGEKFVPEMLIAARAMQAVVNILKPLLVDSASRSLGKVVIGTVAGDLHDIGKNLVGMMLEGAGFELVDLGTDVSSAQFVEAVSTHQPDIVGMSALLTTTMPAIKTTMDAMTEAGVRQNVKVLIGGAPINEDFANKVGADGFAADAGSAPRVAKMVLGLSEA